MFRLGAGLATAVLSLFVLATSLGGVAAQPQKKGAPAAAAPRAAPAPAPRAAPAPAMRSAPPPAARPAPPSIARQAPAISRPAPPPRMVRPQPAPPVAVPTARSAPAAPRAATRIEQRQRAVQQPRETRRRVQDGSATPPSVAASSGNQQRLRQLESKPRRSGSERRELGQLRRDERQNAQQTRGTGPGTAVGDNQRRLQQLETQRRLTRSERRELHRLRRDEPQNAQQDLTADQHKAASANNQRRIQELQAKSRVTRSERRELQELRRQERRNAQQNLRADQPKAASGVDRQRIQELQSKDRLTRAERRELRRLQREERQSAGIEEQQRRQHQVSREAAAQGRRAQRRREISPQQVAQGRFASNISAHHHGRRAARRAARLAMLTAWQVGVLAPYVPWRGPVYWPYAYADVFYYAFWPDAYDPFYWAYAYDDFFDGVFFPDGAPYVEYVAEGPYDSSYARTTSGSRSDGHGGPHPRSGGSVAAPGRVNQATRNFCADQATGVTAWPIGKIAEAVQPTSEQKALLDEVRKASQDAAAQFRDACPEFVPMTPPGRLQAMTQRLQATSDAVSIVSPALESFYNSLSDEQKARFNEIGPQLAKQRLQNTAEAGAPDAQANCSSEKAGLSGIAIDRIEALVEPAEAQEASLDRLDDAMQEAVDILRKACPNTVPLTPVGRLEAMKQRLDAMIQAANAVRPALEDFYAALNDEQKAKFNRLGRRAAQSGG